MNNLLTKISHLENQISLVKQAENDNLLPNKCKDIFYEAISILELTLDDEHFEFDSKEELFNQAFLHKLISDDEIWKKYYNQFEQSNTQFQVDNQFMNLMLIFVLNLKEYIKREKWYHY